MTKLLKEALQNRRSYYAIDKNIRLTHKEIKEIIDFAVKHVPSAFNSQSTRIVLLTGTHHTKLWEIAKETLRKLVPEKAFAQTQQKIDTCFSAGYGTVLFYEEQEVVENLQKAFPLYQENFPGWSLQTSAMHQFAIWTMLEAAGLGASLQHYNPLIDEEVAKTWNIAPTWKLIAQMPFGNPTAEAGEKAFEPLDKRILSFE